MSELNTAIANKCSSDLFASFATAAGIHSRCISNNAAEASFFGRGKTFGTYNISSKNPNVSLEDKLYSARASFKIRLAAIAMHLDKDWRDRLFGQVDSLLDVDEWDESDTPVCEASFATFLRMLLVCRAKRRPGLGATSDGNVVAAWSSGKNRLTIECLPADQVRWVLMRYFDDRKESAAGQTDVLRLPEVLRPYKPERWFFDDEGTKTSA